MRWPGHGTALVVAACAANTEPSDPRLTIDVIAEAMGLAPSSPTQVDRV